MFLFFSDWSNPFFHFQIVDSTAQTLFGEAEKVTTLQNYYNDTTDMENIQHLEV